MQHLSQPALPDDESVSAEHEPPILPPPATHGASRSSVIPPRASAQKKGTCAAQEVHTEELPLPGADESHRLPFWNQRNQRYLLSGACVALLLIFLCLWGSDRLRELEMQWHNGDARITHLDADVGHGGISHFLAFSAKGSVVIVEFSQNGDPTHEHTYVLHLLTTMTDEGNTPATAPRTVTLEVQTIDGKRDVLVHVEGMSVVALLVNTGDAFQTDHYESRKKGAKD